MSEVPTATPSPVVTGTPPNWFIPSEPYVGPIRSGRLTYNQIGHMFPNSCLVYASAAWDIGERLEACEIVFGVDKTTPNSALLNRHTFTRTRGTKFEPETTCQLFRKSVFRFSSRRRATCQQQSMFFIIPIPNLPGNMIPSRDAYLRWTDLADGTGTLIPATDRLTGRQLAFENVIVVFAEHHRFRHNQLEIDFTLGQKHPAYLFRDGQAFQVLLVYRKPRMGKDDRSCAPHALRGCAE